MADPSPGPTASIGAYAPPAGLQGQDWLSAYLELSPTPTLLRADGAISSWNSACEATYGYDAKSALGQNYQALLRAVATVTWDAIESELRSGGAWKGELTCRSFNGQTQIVDCHMRAIQLPGSTVILETHLNLTPLRDEERLRQRLADELKHRVRNTLSVVRSLTNQMLREDDAIETIVQRFSARLTALETAHDGLDRSSWQGDELLDLAHAIVANLSLPADAVFFAGPSLSLTPHTTVQFALLFNELLGLALDSSKRDPQVPLGSLIWRTSERDPKKAEITWDQRRQNRASPCPHTPAARRKLIDSFSRSGVLHSEYSEDEQGVLCKISVSVV